MKILCYGINYSPELTGIGKYTSEMAEWLVSRGHEVRVITAPPYYPAWRIGAGYSGKKYVVEVRGGVTVYRTPLWVPKKPSGLKRLVHLMSFAASSFPTLIRQYFWRPDIVWLVEPPLFCAPSTILFSKFSRAKSWLHIQDFEINAAFEMGILKGERIRSLVLRFESFLLRRFTRISTISGRMMDLARSKGSAENGLRYFPNWVDISNISPLVKQSSYRSELLIPDCAVVALYSGNMGGKQGLEILAEAATNLKDENIYFVLCGNGSGKDELIAACRGLAKVIFLDLQPFERLGELLGLADIHLLPQRSDAADLVMPSKLTGMLASGRPVVATAARHTELATVVGGLGIVTPPEDGRAFSDAIKFLAGDGALRAELGGAARLYAEKFLDKNTVLSNFEQELEACLI